MDKVFFICTGNNCESCPFKDCVRPDRYLKDSDIPFDGAGKMIKKPKEKLPVSVYAACMEKITELQMRIDKLEQEKMEIKEFLEKHKE